MPDGPEIVCICGSTRFVDEMSAANRALTFAGAIVLAPGVFLRAEDREADESISNEQKTALDALHLRKIGLAERERGSPQAHQHAGVFSWAIPRWRKDALFIAERDMSRVTVPDVEPIDPAFTAYVSAQAEASAEAQGWSPALRERVLRSLYLLTAVHGPHENIKASTVATLPRQRAARAITRVTEVLAHLDLLDDGRIDPLDAWIQRRLSNVHPEIRAEALVWIRIVRHGGPCRRPRSTATVRNQVMASIPFLLDCSKRYRTLRQVTRADLTEWLSQCAAPHNEAVALRNMFKMLRSQRLLFANPARGLSLGARPASVPTPLSPEVIQTLAVAAESDPALKLLIALIGIHALYPHQARELPLAAIDFTGGRLLHGDIDHPLDAFAHQAAADYIQLRHSRWPHTRNPHLFLSSQTALSHAGHHRLDAALAQGSSGHRPTTPRGPDPRRGRRHRRRPAAPVRGIHITPDTGLRYTRTFHPDPLSDRDQEDKP